MTSLGTGSNNIKKKRNRKKKNRENKLTTEEICQMPTEDLYNYIENKNNQNPADGVKTNITKIPGIKTKKKV